MLPVKPLPMWMVLLYVRLQSIHAVHAACAVSTLSSSSGSCQVIEIPYSFFWLGAILINVLNAMTKHADLLVEFVRLKPPLPAKLASVPEYHDAKAKVLPFETVGQSIGAFQAVGWSRLPGTAVICQPGCLFCTKGAYRVNQPNPTKPGRPAKPPAAD